MRFGRPASFSRLLVAAILLYSLISSALEPSFADHSSAKSAFSEGRFKDAAALYSQAIKHSGGDSLLYLERGKAYEMINDHQKAAEDFKKAMELDAGNYEAVESLAELYEHQPGRLNDALQMYRRALKVAPERQSKKRLQENIAILENRFQPDEHSAVRCWHLGNIKNAAGDFAKAERYYTKAIRLDPEMFQAYFSRGLARMKTGLVMDALKDFEETVKISPSLRGAYIQKGLANQQLGNTEQSHRDFENAVTMDPRDPYALFHYAGSLETRKEFQEALQYYNEALTRNPKPDLRKLIQERLSALGPVDKLKSSRNPPKKTKDLW
jgi:tetratricopeptide (TPR) repeat protein